MPALLDRFCRYVRVDTQAVEGAATYPSSPGQLVLGAMLAEELRAMGLRDVTITSHGIVLATIPSNVGQPTPTIVWLAHLDTSPETSGHNVKPIVHRNYDGGPIVLPGDRNMVISQTSNPELAKLRGTTLITSDGTTLLGADDKAGVAVIMEAAAWLTAHPRALHGPIRLCFTCDEEIGRGCDHIGLERLDAVAGYTLDGGGQGEIDVETFSADLAIMRITGVNIHPAFAKGKMINAVRLAALFVERLPRTILAPEATADREGFVHPYRIEGGVAEVAIRILLRDFDTSKLQEKADLLRMVADNIRVEYPGSRFDLTVTPQYRNMAEGLAREPRALAFAEEAMKRIGVPSKRTIVRGGTDGSRLTEMGLPTPNLSTGQHNLHSPMEFTSLQEMALAVRILIELAKVWGAATEDTIVGTRSVYDLEL